MKLNEFAKKHAGGKVAFKGEKLVSNYQMNVIYRLKLAHGAGFVNNRATEILGLDHKGLVVYDLTHAEAVKIIEAVENTVVTDENHHNEENSELFDMEQSAENIRSRAYGVGVRVLDGAGCEPISTEEVHRRAGATTYAAISDEEIQRGADATAIKMKGGIIIPKPGPNHSEAAYARYERLPSAELSDPPHHDHSIHPAYPHQLIEIDRMRNEHTILYGIMCYKGLGRTVNREDLTVIQARAMINAAHNIVKEREEEV